MTTFRASVTPTGVAPPGAIVGETPTKSWAATQLEPTQYLTSGDLASGEAGDAGELDYYTIELWVQTLNVTPASTQDLITGPNAYAALPQRQYRIRLSTIGQILFLMRNDSDADQTATASTLLRNGVWHHVCCVYDNGTMRIYIDGAAAGTAAHGGSCRPALIAGSADLRVGSATSVIAVTYDEIAFYRSALSAARVLAHYQAGAQRGFPTQLTGTRAGAVLDTLSSQAARQIGTGARQVIPTYMTGQDPLVELRYARSADAVDALLFASRSGTIVYLDAAHRSASPYNTVQATFDDDGTDLPYHDLGLDYSESYLTNEWNLTRIGNEAVTQTATDATSVSRYYRRAQSVTGLPVVSDGDVSTIAAAMLAKYKDPLTRVTSISLSTSNPAVTEAVFRRDIGDRIRVFRTPPGGGSRIDQTLFLQGIQVDATPSGPWRVTWRLSPV